MPTIGDLQNANKRLIITGFNDLRSFSECSENNPDDFDNTWNLENYDSSFMSRKQTNILMCFSKDDTIGTGAYDESINNNKYDFLLRFTQRSWLNTGRKPMHLLIDFCDTGDLIAVSEKINSYPIYKGLVRNLPSGEELQWELIYENNGVEISQIGYSDQWYSFPGTIWFGGAYYSLKSLNPLSEVAGISMTCETVSTRGGLTVSEREYSYGSGVIPFPAETFPEGTSLTIRNRDCNLYLTISEGSASNGASAVGDVLCGGQEQKFIVNRTGEYYRFEALHSGKRLEVDNPSDPFTAYDAYLQRDQYNQKGHFEDARVHQYSINDKLNQMWKLSRRANGSYVLISRESGKALTLTGDSVGSGVTMKEYCGMTGQSWELIKE